MKKSALLILVLSFVMMLTALSVGAMSLGQTISVDARAGVNSDNVPGLGANPQEAESSHERVNMVFMTVDDPIVAARAAEDLVSLLSDQTGYQINAILADCPGAAVDMMVAGDADFGWLSAVSYVYAHELGGVQVKLVAERFGSTFYRGQFIVRKDSGLNTLADLAGKNFAFADPLSTSGYLYPSLHISNTLGVTPDNFFANTLFADGHFGVVNAVYNGDFDGTPVDGGATFESILTFVDKEVADAIKVIQYTELIPNDTVSVRPGLDAIVVQTVIDAITAVAGTPKWDTLMQDLYAWGDVAPVEDNSYDIVRQAVEAFNLEFVTCSTITVLDTGGGSLTHTNNNGLTTTVQVAAGTFTETVELNYAQVPAVTHLPRSFIDAGVAFNLTAVISSTGKNVASVSNPYQMAVAYDEGQLGGLHENELALYSWDGAGWVREPTSRVDTENNLVLANPDHFSLFAVLGSKKTFVPVIIGG